MLDCEKVTERLSDHLDGRAGLDRAGIEEHLARCPRCSEMLEDLKALSRAFRLVPAFEPPGDLWERAARRARRKAARRRRLVRFVLPAAAAAVALFVLAFPRAEEPWELPLSLAEMRAFETFERERAEDSLVGASPVGAVRMVETEAELAFYSGGRR